jgi:hypothetical protein
LRLRSTVFDSASERMIFRALDSRWSPRLRLYPSLPLSKIVELEQADGLPANERRFFYATNVDYTFCEPTGRPVMSIEFDGIGGGFSRDGTYFPKRQTPDPNRKWKLDFKLRVARSVGFPFGVVSSEETEELGPGVSLTVLDSVIGRCLARRREAEIIEELIAEALELRPAAASAPSAA